MRFAMPRQPIHDCCAASGTPAVNAGIPADGRILVVIVARIGDTLLVTPALRALKALIPQGELKVLAHPKRACLLAHLPFIDSLDIIDKRRAPWRARLPWRRRAALAVVWGHDSELVAFGLRSSVRTVAFEGPGLPASTRLLKVPRPTESMHAVRERLLLAEVVGARCSAFGLSYVVAESEQRVAKQWLAEAGGARRWVGIQPLSFPTKAHRDWPLEHFAAVVAGLAASRPDIGFVVLGDADALPAANRLSDCAPGRVVAAAGRFDLRGSAAIIGELALYIGVDTGPTHLAGALGIPMVALYHCAYPGRNLMPLEHPALRMFEHPATGAAQAREGSMAEIKVEPVLDAALELLDTRAGQR